MCVCIDFASLQNLSFLFSHNIALKGMQRLGLCLCLELLGLEGVEGDCIEE